MGISRFIGDFLQTVGGRSRAADSAADGGAPSPCRVIHDDVLLRALITVFGMRENGRIKKEKAKGVVEKLGLIKSEEEKEGFELPADGGGDEVAVEEVIGEMEEEGKRNELLWEAFKIFDVDGDGFIDTVELKRVLECLGLDKGWGIREIEKMVSVVDVNLDGKVDFGEFELMMGVKCS
ncbi:calmodulin-like protein 2 [Cucurbita maxima]|uniref:Calmodulin-like protein 2 n=1 Tax=Cucurbita maxima TaxID=3661 RepID=A0A6J1KJR1_CUCMA|nr:calmodulin-like protein 2 [Cucurbita maxima]